MVRASLAKFAVVLASATPSIESHVNARSGRYAQVELPGRYSGAELPEVATIDLRQHPPERGKWLSPVLVEAVTETLAKKQQALLFLNRRGYAPLTLCRTCGHRIDCPQCTAWLVEHRYPPPAQLPPLRLLAADPGEVPQVRRARRARGLRPGRGAHRRGGGGALSARRAWRCSPPTSCRR